MAKVLNRPKTGARHRLWEHDAALCEEHGSLIGVDEAGRGAFAGPVVASAVYLPKDFFKDPLLKKASRPMFDSKQVAPEERAILFDLIASWQASGLLRFAAAEASASEVEEHNVVGATVLAMSRALESLGLPLASLEAAPLPLLNDGRPVQAPHVLVDGRPLRKLRYAHAGLVQGDTKSLAIAMASIIAKVSRDRTMVALSAAFPAYGFASHKGYGTPFHQAAIEKHGILSIHRRTFLKNIASTQATTSDDNHAQSQLALTRC